MKNSTLAKELNAQFYQRNMPALSLAVFAALLAGSLNLILSWIIRQLIDAIQGVPGTYDLAILGKISGGFLLLAIAAFLLRHASLPYYIRRAMQQYKNFAFEKLTNKSISSFRDESTATYLSALTNDATSIETDYLNQQINMITEVVTFVGALAMMLWYSPLMTAIAIGITILPIIASLLTGNKLEPVERRVSDCNKEFTASLNDMLSGFSVVKSFKAEKEIFKQFAASNQKLENEKFGRRRLKIIVGMIGAVAGICAQLGVFIVGAWLALSGRSVTAGTVIMFVNLMNFIIQPIAELPGLLASRKAARGLIGKLATALEKNAVNEGAEKIDGIEKGISLDNVSFGYEEGKQVLHDISVTFDSGKSYAIVGGSGSGKSTLLHLLMAGSNDYTGKILFDDKELRSISSESLYEICSAIQQNVFVFNASIRDNVTMFRDFPQEALDDAMRRAHLMELIEERGEDYLCGENGSGLSGGEKQRISIARSLLKNSELLLADEATSSLDAQTAHQVSSDLLDIEDVTRIVVTHTLEESLLKRYDGIIVMKDGRIEEKGNFDELMSKKGYFYALFTVAQ